MFLTYYYNYLIFFFGIFFCNFRTPNLLSHQNIACYVFQYNLFPTTLSIFVILIANNIVFSYLYLVFLLSYLLSFVFCILCFVFFFLLFLVLCIFLLALFCTSIQLTSLHFWFLPVYKYFYDLCFCDFCDFCFLLFVFLLLFINFFFYFRFFCLASWLAATKF